MGCLSGDVEQAVGYEVSSSVKRSGLKTMIRELPSPSGDGLECTERTRVGQMETHPEGTKKDSPSARRDLERGMR